MPNLANDKPFGRVLSIDKTLLYSDSALFAIRSRSETLIQLFSVNALILNIVAASHEMGPDIIRCEKLPSADFDLPTDGWKIKDAFLQVPYLAQLNLADSSLYDAVSEYRIKNFPFYSHSTLSTLIASFNSKELAELNKRFALSIKNIKETGNNINESVLINIIGFGNNDLPIGDSAMAGFLLTTKFCAQDDISTSFYNLLSMFVRRLQYKSSFLGRHCLKYALESRLTETQKNVFIALKQNKELSEELTNKIVTNHHNKAFIIGVNAALQLIKIMQFLS